jgi:hypothetical protein
MVFLGDLVDHRIDTKSTDSKQKLDRIDATVARMDEKLNGISNLAVIIIQNELKRLSLLSPKELNDTLPQVQTILTVAKTEKVPQPKDALNEIRLRLANSKAHADQFWGAAGALISYRSNSESKHYQIASIRHLP